MYSTIKRVACFLFCSIVALYVMAGTQAVAKDDDLIWGINGHPFISYPGVSRDEQLDLIYDLGLTSYRVGVTSLDHLKSLADLIEKAERRNITILPVLVPPVSLKKSDPETLYRQSYAFAKRFVSRFKHKIRVWELGNELENFAIIRPCEIQDDGVQYNCEWGPASGVTKLEYHGGRWKKVSSVLKGLSDATMAVDPTARKAIGTAGWGHVGAFGRMKDDGIVWDISVWHDYSGEFEWGLEKVAKFGKPIWVTEFNFDSGSKKGLVAQAKGIATSISELRRLRDVYNIEAAHIYELLDETYWAPNFEAYMGLVHLEKVRNRNWRAAGPKSAYCSVRNKLRGGYRTPINVSKPPAETTSSASDEPLPKRTCNLCEFKSRGVTLEEAIAYTYCLALTHPHDGGGLAAWSRDVRNGKITLRQLQKSMVQLHMQRVRTKKRLNPRQYVAYLNRLLLDDEPGGPEYWALVRELERGNLSRDEIIDIMLGSAKFQWVHPTLFHIEGEALLR